MNTTLIRQKNWLNIGIKRLNSFTGLTPRANPVEIDMQLRGIQKLFCKL